MFVSGSYTQFHFSVDRCHTEANLKCLHAGLDDRGEDRFALSGVRKHVRDLVQEAAETSKMIMV